VKKKISILAFMLFAACLLSGCGKRTDVKQGEPFIYALNGDRTGLVKVSYAISGKDVVQKVENMLKELKKPAEDIEYSATIPKGVRVQNLEMKHTIAYIDFNQKYLGIPPLEEKLVRAAVTQSLVQIEGVRGVYITVDKEELKDEDGNPVGILNEDDFVQNIDGSPSSYEKTEVALYFANGSGDKLVRQQVDVKYSSNMSREKLIVEKLMHGPQTQYAYPTLNPAATLLGVSIKDGTCYVNFDSEFLNSVYDVRPEITIYSLVNSLVEGTAASKVQITVNGEKNVRYMNTVDLSQPLKQNLEWMGNAE